MNDWSDIRRLARDRHRELVGDAAYTAESLLQAAASRTGHRSRGVEADNPRLEKGEGKLDCERKVIWFNADAPIEQQHFVRAHEYAHVWLETGGYACLASEIDEQASEDRGAVGGIARVEGYSPRERAEREANVFAREFLLPTGTLRTWYDAGLSASEIASRVGVSRSLVFHQISRAVLVAESLVSATDKDVVAEEGRGADLRLDPSQEAAAKAAGPILIVAGPGTGKTRTLTKRVAHLVESGVDPERILALTYSNRAADEMRGRVSKSLGDAAHKVWMGTFHAFGLELLHKYNEDAGLPLHPTVLDSVDASVLLEGALGGIDLGYYEVLSDPGRNLPDILSAISRAKDEMVGPEEYAALANRMAETASNAMEVEKAAKAQDVARAYAAYQNLLHAEGGLDFGDLIYRSVRLLESNDGVRKTVQKEHPHVLVDEFQDVNRASGRLLKAVSGEGEGLWIVGDPRQSIYRWRGASSANFDRLHDDFPALRTERLARNYRSRPAVINVVSAIASSMRAAPPGAFEPWTVDRDDEPGEVSLSVATSLEAEGLGLAQALRDHALAELNGGEARWKSQAVLCRTHTLLERYARILEAEGVPTLYLGDVFERDEVRDLLALVDLISSSGWGGLVRVAAFPEYAVPREDVVRVLQWAEDNGRRSFEALSEAAEIGDLTDAGAKGLALLRDHVVDIHPNLPVWDALSAYLFNQSRYIHNLSGDNEVETRQKRLAVYQLLTLALGHRSREGAAPGYSRRTFLDYVRRLSLQSEDRQVRQVPEWADDINAVRLLTVHASKGLEFDIVHVPALAKAYFPITYRPSPCPLPDGLIEALPKDLHDDEEECLFFVAASRARDALYFSRAERYLRTSRDPSVLLDLASGALPATSQRWTDEPAEALEDKLPTVPHYRDPGVPFTRTELDTYLRCPRQYAYEHVLHLDGRTEGAAYLDFHRAARKAVRYVLGERAEGRRPRREDALVILDESWSPRLAESPYGDRLRAEAEQMVVAALDAGADTEIRPEWMVRLRNGQVIVRPDAASRAESGGHVQKWKTGRLSKTEADKEVYALLHQAAAEAYGDYTIETVQFETGERTPMTMTDRKRTARLEKYAAAIDGILAGAFPTNPSSRVCPRCPFYFVCPR